MFDIVDDLTLSKLSTLNEFLLFSLITLCNTPKARRFSQLFCGDLTNFWILLHKFLCQTPT